MPSLRSVLVAASSATVCIAALWLLAHCASPQVRPASLIPGQPYAVEVAFERAELRLPFDRRTRYLLIVASLGRQTEPYTIGLQAEPADSLGSFSARPLEPWDRQSKAETVESAEPPAGKRSDANHRRQRPRVAVHHTSRSPHREFFLHVADGSLENPKNYARVTARLVGEGEHVRVFLDESYRQDDLASGLIDEIVFQFDRRLVPSFGKRLGRYRDVDRDGKFTVLLSPQLNRLQGGKTSLGGFVRASDFRGSVPAPFSNHCDMMYLNTNLAPGPHLQTLLAHEYTHAVCFSERLACDGRSGGLPDEQDWLNEAIAHLSENIEGGSWSNLDYRISRFLNDPQRYPLVVEDYYAAGLWRNHGCRGATYLFLRWCVDRFGTDLLRRLVQAPRRGPENLQWATGHRFEELFRRWTLALYQAGLHAAPNTGPPQQLAGQSFGQQERAPRNDRDGEVRFAERLTSIDLRRPLGRYGLAGPRVDEWNIRQGPKEVQVAGTAAAFLRLQTTQPGTYTIRVEAPFGTHLQVTLLRLPDDWPSLSVQAHLAASAETSAGASASDAAGAANVKGDDVEVSPPSRVRPVRLKSQRANGVPVVVDVAAPTLDVSAGGLEIETIICEHLGASGRRSVFFAGEQLVRSRRTVPPIRPLPGRRRVGPAERASLPCRFELPLELTAETAGQWTVKVVARDRSGHRTTAHTAIEGHPVHTAPVRVASTETGLKRYPAP